MVSAADNPWDPLWHPYPNFNIDDDPRPRQQAPTPSPREQLKTPSPKTYRPDPTSYTPHKTHKYPHPPSPNRDPGRIDRIPLPSVLQDSPTRPRTHVRSNWTPKLSPWLTTMPEAEEFQVGHQDRVEVLNVNFDGTRILTASVDHRVKVWDRSVETGAAPTLIDTFTAHDADIRDAKWLSPTTGSHIATVGNDRKFRLWQEDPSQPRNSGRCFKRIYQMEGKSPYVSLDVKTIDNVHTYLAIIDRRGHLSIHEPSNLDDLREWNQLDEWDVHKPVPDRGEETSFRVRFDQSTLPAPYVTYASDDKRMLSLVVGSMKDVIVYRTSGLQNSNSRSRFVEAARLEPHPALVRDVQWGFSGGKAFDTIATACKDGKVRIFELSTLPEDSSNASFPLRASSGQVRPTSNLTTVLAGRPSVAGTLVHNGTASRPPHEAPFKTKVVRVALIAAHNDAWALSWDPTGQMLMSSGADGKTKFWRKSIEDGQWLKSVEMDADAEGSDQERGDE